MGEEQGKRLPDKADSYESKEQEKPIKQLCDSQSGVSYAKDHQPVQGFHDHRKTEPIHETSELLADLPICKSSKHEAKMKLEILETISLVENVSEVKASETVFKTPESQVLTNSQRKRRNKKNKMNKFKDGIGRIDQTNFSQEQRDKFNKVNLGVCQTQKSDKNDKKRAGVQKNAVKILSNEESSSAIEDKPQTNISTVDSEVSAQQSVCREVSSLDEKKPIEVKNKLESRSSPNEQKVKGLSDEAVSPEEDDKHHTHISTADSEVTTNQSTCEEKNTLDQKNLIEVESQPEETPSNSEEQGKSLPDKADSYVSNEQEKPIEQLCDSQSGVSNAKDHQPVQGFDDHVKTELIHETSELLADLPICKSSKHEAKMKFEILETKSLVENVSEVKASETVFQTP